MSEKICSNCGASLDEDQKFCTVCGTEVSAIPGFVPEYTTQQPTEAVTPIYISDEPEAETKTEPESKKKKPFNLFKLFFFIMLPLLLISVALNVASITVMNSKLEAKDNIISDMGYENMELYDEIETLEDKVDSLTSELDKVNSRLTAQGDTKEVYDFVNKHVVFIENDNSNLYHKFECPRFKRVNFWVYNTEAAVSKGFSECPLCH